MKVVMKRLLFHYSRETARYDLSLPRAPEIATLGHTPREKHYVFDDPIQYTPFSL